MTKLHIADYMSLPLDAVTQTFGLLAKRRAGKSYAARRFAEQFAHAKQQVVIIDPKGDWWGIRASADGKAPGLPIVMLGGERGDVAIEPGAGEVVAKLVVEDRVSALIDLSLFRKHEAVTFITAFMETLYRLKAREAYRTPMMLIVDEADAVAPQRPQKGEERMLGAAEDIVRRGGQRGIGCMLVTQRAAVLNKNVLTQVQVLICLRTIAPQDLAALNAWIDVHGTQEQRKTLMESLPALPVGDAWFWSPGWPSDQGIFARAHVKPIETFDSGATPKPGEKRSEPKMLADVDLDAVRKAMADVIKRTEADDPKALRREIAELKKQLARPAEEKIVERRVATKEDEQLAGELIEHADRLKLAIDEAVRAGSAVRETMLAHADAIRAIKTGGIIQGPDFMHQFAVLREERHGDAMVPMPLLSPQRGRSVGVPAPIKTISVSVNGSDLTGPERKLLTALAQHGRRTRKQLAILTGYAHNGGGFGNYISSLCTRGLMERPSPGDVDITDKGMAALGPWSPLPTGRELAAHWLAQLGKAERLALEALIRVWPKGLTKEQIAAATGYEADGGGFGNALSRLRSLELAHGRGVITASEALFDRSYP